MDAIQFNAVMQQAAEAVSVDLFKRGSVRGFTNDPNLVAALERYAVACLLRDLSSTKMPGEFQAEMDERRAEALEALRGRIRERAEVVLIDDFREFSKAF